MKKNKILKGFEMNKKTLTDILETNIIDMDFSVRAINTIRANDINTLSQLACYSAKELVESKNFGKKTLTEVMEQLKSLGLELKKD